MQTFVSYTIGMVRTEKRYILHPRGTIIGDNIVSGIEVPIRMGNALPLSAVKIVDVW